MNIGDIIIRCEDYQRKTKRHFGTDIHDFKMAFFWLGINLKVFKFADFKEESRDTFSNITLKDWIPHILNYADIYFNDEGLSWDPEYSEKPVSVINHQIREFFRNPDNCVSGKIRDYFEKFGKSSDILESFSNPG
jgi:hypothetical protein